MTNASTSLRCATSLFLALMPFAVTAEPISVLVTNSNAIINANGAPGGITSFTGAALSDDGRSVQVNLSSGNGNAPWIYRNGGFARYALVESPGQFGPARTSAESAHVFRALHATRDLANGQVTFVGQAGPSNADTSTLPLAAWRNSGGQNVEMMRLGTDTALGPNLGPGWRFGSSGSFSLRLNQTDTGHVMFDTLVMTPGDLTRHAMVLHRPGVGNAACMIQGETGVLGPNVANPDAIFIGASLGYVPATFDQRMYVNATIEGNGYQEGIWRICDGAPAPIALQNTAGALGPGTSASGRFGQVRSNARALGDAAVVFLAEYRAFDAASLAHGLFLHSGGSNQLIVAEDTTSTLGPQFQDTVFDDLQPALTPFASAGHFVAFETDVRRQNNTRSRGLWRLHAGGTTEPLVVEGEPGMLAQGGQVQRIDRWVLLGNGDLIAELAVTGGTGGLYLFESGRPSRLLLASGQSIAVPTSLGPRSVAISSFALANDGLGSQNASSHWSGYDGWAGRNGNILLNASFNLDGNAVNALLLMQASDQGRLFKDGFEVP